MDKLGKIQLTFKTPGVLDEPLKEFGETAADVEAIAKDFVKWSEYVTIEIDLDKRTATVLPA